ncbi:MAG: hypothetical protein SFU86_06935 [Pirellulaceae bacterium]|nr:hypothetical protein [Pirellulaceae bacterium]
MNDLWPEIERWLFGEALSGEVGGQETSFQPTWDIPPWLVLLVLGISATLLLAVYWRESPSAARPWKIALATFRLALVGLVLLMLYGWTVQRHRTDLPDVVLVIDDSASMGLVDHYDDPRLASEIDRRLARATLPEASRLNLAKVLLLENNGRLIAQLAERYNLRVFLAGSAARAVSSDQRELADTLDKLAPEQPSSRLGDCLREVLEAQRGRPTAAVIVLTDGVTTEGKPLAEAAQYARRKAVPLFAIGLGSDRPTRDLRLSDLLVEDSVFVGDLIHFDFKLSSEVIAGKATVRLLVAPAAEEAGTTPGEVVATQEINIDPSGAAQQVRLTHRPERKGAFDYTVEVVPRDGEANLDNNRLVRRITVREEIIRVLLVQAYPSYEFRFLKQMLERELNRDQPPEGKTRGFRTVLQEADLEYVDTDKSAERVFPVGRDELFAFDVLIFGDVNPALLSPSIMQNIYEFVTVRGGGLIFMAGPRYTPLAYRDTPLAPLFPMNLDVVSIPDPDAIVTEAFRPRLTPLGQTSPLMQLADSPTASDKLWREGLAPLRWFAKIPESRPGTRVLAEHPTFLGDNGQPLPIILLQFIGAGKVLFHATDETYRWRFRAGDVYFARYWVQAIRYLCRAKLLAAGRGAELTTDRDEYRRGDPVRLRVRFFDDRLAPQADDGVVVVIQRAGGERRAISLRRTAADRGIFEGVSSGLADGDYRVWIAAPTLEGQPPAQEFVISAPPGELARTRMDAAELAQAAKISLGKFYRFAEVDRLLADLPRGRQVRIESLPPRPIWNAPLLAGLFVLLIGGEWLLRKRLGLL